jgi:hypothetical protein
MEAGRLTPAPKRNLRKQKKIRVQIGDDLNLTVGFYVSARVMALLGMVTTAGGGYCWYNLIQP